MKNIKKIVSIILITVLLLNILSIHEIKATEETNIEENSNIEENVTDSSNEIDEQEIKETEKNEIEENKIEQEEVEEEPVEEKEPEEKEEVNETEEINETYKQEKIEDKKLVLNQERRNVEQNKQTISDGYYIIATALNNKKVLDVSAASKDNCANIQIWDNVNVKQQKFKVTYNGNGYYTIKNVLSTKVLDVANGIGKSGTNVWQYEVNGSNPQAWSIRDAGDGYYYIVSALNDLYLDVEDNKTKSGTNVRVCEENGTEGQKFKFIETKTAIAEKTIEDGYYTIATKLNTNRILDISGASKSNGGNVQIWDNTDVKQQKFKITYNGDGYYIIRNVLSNKVLDVTNGAGRSGANVQQFEYNGTNAQKWIIDKDKNGFYYIVSALNDTLVLDVANASSACGTNVWIYESNKSDAQKFKFTKTEAIIAERTISDGIYKIAMLQKRNIVLDIDAGSNSDGANVQTWTYENVLQQKFEIKYNGDGYYTIKSMKSGKVLDVANGSGSNGTNVWQYGYNGSNAQKWIINDLGWGIYNIVSACNDKFLTIANENAGCGTNVEINQGNKPNSQKFVFEKVTVITAEQGTYGSSGLQIKGDYRGSSLKYYKIGNGPNVFFGTFAIHGWEDEWSFDGQELTKIAETFKDRLVSMQDEGIANKWTIYLFPSVNPDGEYHGWTNNGPGRTSLYSAAPGNKGIDINRGWSVGYSRQTNDRNYNGTESFQAYEARALRDFLLSRRATNRSNSFSRFTWMAK